MNPIKARELVGGYSRLTKEIKLLGDDIGKYLDQCKGRSGVRGEFVDGGYEYKHQPDYDEKGRDKDVHLWHWYQPETRGDGYYTEPYLVWREVGEQEMRECPCCYVAHNYIQRRKEARKELGRVKAAMTRFGS